MDGSGSDSDDFNQEGGHEGEDIGPMVEVVYPLNEETEVPGTHGQLFKTVLVEGTGGKPMKGAEVVVHYVGTLLNGEKFDSSRDRNDHFKFKIGQGQVIKGWDQGVITMRIGEKAILKCFPEYAYGARGSPPKIPGNSTLLFEVELFDFTLNDDISDNKDRTLMKKCLAAGQGYQSPSFESVVSLDVVAEANGKQLFSLAEPSFTVGEGKDLPPLLETIVQKLKKGESCEVAVHPTLITQDYPQFSITKGQGFTYRITVKSFTDAPKAYQFKGAEKLAQGVIRKDQGNEYFKAGDFDRAQKKYTKGLEFVGGSWPEDAEKAESVKLNALLENNLAMVSLKLGQAKQAYEHANAVVKLDPTNVKGLFRRGKASSILGDWEEAKTDFEAALRLEPSNGDARSELTAVTAKVTEFENKQKNMYKNMFSGI